jgi:hypothetical protein
MLEVMDDLERCAAALTGLENEVPAVPAKPAVAADFYADIRWE